MNREKFSGRKYEIEKQDLTHVGKTKNGFDVLVDTKNSHAATHMQDTPDLFEILSEAVQKHEINTDEERFHIDMERKVGESDLVETDADDDVFYAKRPNRSKYTRFVRNKSALATHFVTIDLRKLDEDSYYVYTAYPGMVTPSLPLGKEDLDEKKRNFWKNHALVVGKQEILEDTIIKECPW